jgi:hypothetical protein
MSLKTESIKRGHADTYREYNRMRLADFGGSGRGDVSKLILCEDCHRGIHGR